MTTIEFKPRFKEGFKNHFLQLSQFITESILLFEHAQSDEFKEYLEDIEKQFYESFESLMEDIKENYDRFFMDLFYEFESKIEDFPAVSYLKTPWDQERRLIDEQYQKLISSDYDDRLASNLKFTGKIEDAFRIISPDHEFSSEIERKELWILSLGDKDLPPQDDDNDNDSEKNEEDSMGSIKSSQSIVIGRDPTQPRADETEKKVEVINPGSSHTDRIIQQRAPSAQTGSRRITNNIFPQLKKDNMICHYQIGQNALFSFTIGEQNGGILTGADGLSTFKIINNEFILVEKVPESGNQGIDFQEVLQFTKDTAYVVGTTEDDEQHIYEINTEGFASYGSITQTFTNTKGKSLKKDSINFSIGFLIAVNRVAIMSNPNDRKNYTQKEVHWDYMIEDFVLVDEDKIALVSSSGFLSYQSHKTGENFLQFRLDLDTRERISCIDIDTGSEYLAICTNKENEFGRIFIYQIMGTLLCHLTDFKQSDSRFPETTRRVHDINFKLIDVTYPVLVAFEYTMQSSMRVWRLIDRQLVEVTVHNSFVYGFFKAHQVHMNCLWTLDDVGNLKMTPIEHVVHDISEDEYR